MTTNNLPYRRGPTPPCIPKMRGGGEGEGGGLVMPRNLDIYDTILGKKRPTRIGLRGLIHMYRKYIFLFDI